jgi:hypothetical protein
MQGYVGDIHLLSSNYLKLYQRYNVTVPKGSLLKMKCKLGTTESISSYECSLVKNINYNPGNFF